MNDTILSFGLAPQDFQIQRISTGHINATYKLVGHPGYILQRINKNVFLNPEIIAANIRTAADYLKEKCPDYLFLSPERTTAGKEMSYDAMGYPWRLFRYIENTFTLDKVNTVHQAYGAASGFASLTRNLEGIEVNRFNPSIDHFHDLNWRYDQFQEAIKTTTPERLGEASDVLESCRAQASLVMKYTDLISRGILRHRITHNDTKINNILVDTSTHDAVCVIDLDTLMPGYFIYDVGDMIRTFVPPVNEEAVDTNEITFRKPIYDAVVDGYLSHMGDRLTDEEKKLFPFAGTMMTYIMALRFITDFLKGDVYYQVTYSGQNLVRAKNQLKLLEVLIGSVGV